MPAGVLSTSILSNEGLQAGARDMRVLRQDQSDLSGDGRQTISIIRRVSGGRNPLRLCKHDLVHHLAYRLGRRGKVI